MRNFRSYSGSYGDFLELQYILWEVLGVIVDFIREFWEL